MDESADRSEASTAWPAMPLLPVAWGEVFDKLTILEIKAERLDDPAKRANVERERAAIVRVVGALERFPAGLAPLIGRLKAINAELWDVEDGKRDCERRQSFDDAFVQLARRVYVGNDERAAIKRQINQLLGSALVEEKSHRGYGPAATAAAPKPRRPRLLWASVYCLLDSASGAAMAVRQMLLQLVRQGYEVQILGAAVFDHERGTAGLRGQWPAAQARRGGLVELADGLLQHRLYVTQSTVREQMSAREEGAWIRLYQQALDQFRPDLVFYYGGQPLDFLIAAEARARAIPAVFYLANGSYTQARWCRDVTLVLTDSQATAQMYEGRLGIRPQAVGAFIDPARVLAQQPTRKRILFINPTLEKGVAVVIRLAMLLEQRRPDIVFEVVESRGSWAEMLRQVSAALGQPRESLANVVVTPNSSDMRPIYGRARVLLAPSLWWESSGRVLVEALLNAIPAIVTDHGGMAEMVQGAGMVLKLAPVYHEAPYARVPADEALEPLLQFVQQLYDDEAVYAQWVARARQVGQTRHHLDASTARLIQALQPLLDQRAGDADFGARVRQLHRHGLDDRQRPP